jgi:hypothetical protein
VAAEGEEGGGRLLPAGPTQFAARRQEASRATASTQSCHLPCCTVTDKEEGEQARTPKARQTGAAWIPLPPCFGAGGGEGGSTVGGPKTLW